MAIGTARVWSLERYMCGGEESLLPTATGCGFERGLKVGYIIYRVRRGSHIGGDSVDGQWPQRRDGSSEF